MYEYNIYYCYYIDGDLQCANRPIVVRADSREEAIAKFKQNYNGYHIIQAARIVD